MKQESIHELLKKVYPLKLRMELFNAIWIDLIKEGQQTEMALKLACENISCKRCPYSDGEKCSLAEDYGYYPTPNDCIQEKVEHFKTKAKEK